eukprot:10703735-Heterocapsa_arctica.AAC.1
MVPDEHAQRCSRRELVPWHAHLQKQRADGCSERDEIAREAVAVPFPEGRRRRAGLTHDVLGAGI